jgi:hypothetical protein
MKRREALLVLSSIGLVSCASLPGTVVTQVQKDAQLLDSVATQLLPLISQVSGLPPTTLTVVQAALNAAVADAVDLMRGGTAGQIALDFISSMGKVVTAVAAFVPIGSGIVVAIQAAIILASAIAEMLGASPPSPSRAAGVSPDRARKYLMYVAKHGIRP